jgi:hypothetical protein
VGFLWEFIMDFGILWRMYFCGTLLVLVLAVSVTAGKFISFFLPTSRYWFICTSTDQLNFI